MNEFQPDLDAAIQAFEKELATIRTGRANPALIEDLPVACYGASSPLVQVASISSPEPQVLVVQPWDASIIKDIEKALSTSNLGINPVVDGNLIRLPFPPMTEERRKELLKVVHEKSEQTRIRVRGVREDMIKTWRAQEKDHQISKDALETSLKQLQTAVDATNERVAEIVKAKTEELMTI